MHIKCFLIKSYNVLHQNTKYRCLKCLPIAIEFVRTKTSSNMKYEQYLSHFFKTDDTILVHINCRKLIPQIGDLFLIKCAS